MIRTLRSPRLLLEETEPSRLAPDFVVVSLCHFGVALSPHQLEDVRVVNLQKRVRDFVDEGAVELRADNPRVTHDLVLLEDPNFVPAVGASVECALHDPLLDAAAIDRAVDHRGKSR